MGHYHSTCYWSWKLQRFPKIQANVISMLAHHNYMVCPIAEDTTQFGCRTWGNQSQTHEETSSMIPIFNTSGDDCGGCWQ